MEKVTLKSIIDSVDKFNLLIKKKLDMKKLSESNSKFVFHANSKFVYHSDK